MQNYDLVIANDHGGFELKLKILDFLIQNGYKTYSNYSEKLSLNLELNNQKTILDLGCDSLERVDYPDYAKKLVEEIIEGNVKYGILICNTGIGMSIAANRSSVIRAALCLNKFMAERARSHNDANVLVLASNLTEEKTVFQIIEKFLSTSFENGRHAQRVNKIS
jgi:ribose 5-phosphate isomerase B